MAETTRALGQGVRNAATDPAGKDDVEPHSGDRESWDEDNRTWLDELRDTVLKHHGDAVQRMLNWDRQR